MLDLDGVAVDSLVDMLKMAFSSDNYLAMIEISDKLFEHAAIMYDSIQHNLLEHNCKRSIVYYFGYSLCMRGIAFQRMEDFAESRKCVQQYADLSWMKSLDEEGMLEVAYYKKIAMANNYVLDLLVGKLDVLPDYVEFVSKNDKEEVLAGLITVLQSAIRHNYTIDWVLDEWRPYLYEINHVKRENVRYYMDYIYLLAAYYYKHGRIYESLELILEIMESSSKLDDRTGFQKSVALYELMRGHATTSQQQAHHNIMEKILEEGVLSYEKKVFFHDSCFIGD